MARQQGGSSLSPKPALPLDASELPALFADFSGRRHVILAVSGGADSTAMMVLAARWHRQGGTVPLSVVTINHGLRAESAQECARVAAQATALGLPCTILAWTGPKPTSRLQEKARNARYQLLADAARETGADTIATAHTLDDQAETVLMRLAHGSAVDGLGAMRPAKQRGALLHLRPLLGLGKARLIATLGQAGFDWIEDPSNYNLRFERTRIRGLLAAVAPSGLQAERLALLAKRAQRATQALEHIAGATFAAAMRPDGDGVWLDAAVLAQAPAEIRLRVLGRAIDLVRRHDIGDYAVRLERLEALGVTIDAALQGGRKKRRKKPWRKSLGRTLVSLDEAGNLSVHPEPPRFRGRSSPAPKM